MKTRLLILLVACLLSTFAQGATYKNDATAVSLTGKNGQHDWGVAIIRASDNTYYTTGSYSPVGGTGATTFAKTISSAQLTFDFYIVVFSAYDGLYSNVDNASASGGAGTRWKWISAYEVGGSEPQQSSSGPYSGTNPTFDNGNPADPAVGGSPAPTAYEKDLTLTNSSATDKKGYQVKMLSASNQVLSSTTYILQPGETQNLHFSADEPFTLQVFDMVQVKQPDEEFPGDGTTLWMATGNPVQTLTATGTQNAPPSEPQATVGSSTKAGTSAQAAAQKNTISTATTGATSKDMSGVSNNITNEIARGTEQTRASGDEVRDAVDRATKAIGELGAGGQSGTSGPELGTPSASGLSFAQGISGKIGGIGDALGNLMSAAGLANSPGYNALTWNVEVMGHTQSFSVEQFSDEISAARSGVLWVAGAIFLWAAFGIVRGAFVDEGK